MFNKSILSESYETPVMSEMTVVNFGSVLCTSTGEQFDPVTTWDGQGGWN